MQRNNFFFRIKNIIKLQTSITITDNQKTIRNWGASAPAAGSISQRQGSSSSDTGQYPANVTRSPDATAEPNSKTVTSAGRRTSTAPFNPNTSFASIFPRGSPFTAGAGPFLPVSHDSKPIGEEELGLWTQSRSNGYGIEKLFGYQVIPDTRYPISH